jgi:hypothetical protein
MYEPTESSEPSKINIIKILILFFIGSIVAIPLIKPRGSTGSAGSILIVNEIQIKSLDLSFTAYLGYSGRIFVVRVNKLFHCGVV